MAAFEKSTPTLGMVLGVSLILLGVGAYVVSDFESVTALIPAIFGILIGALGIVGHQTDRTRLAIYGIGLVSILGVLGSAQGIPDVIALLTGESVESIVAPVSQGTMTVICLVLLGAVAKSIVDTR